MISSIYNSNCLVKSFISNTAIQEWIDENKRNRYVLTFFNTQYDPTIQKILYTAVLELKINYK